MSDELPVLNEATIRRLVDADCADWIPSLRRDLAVLAKELGLPPGSTEDQIHAAALAAQKEKES